MTKYSSVLRQRLNSTSELSDTISAARTHVDGWLEKLPNLAQGRSGRAVRVINDICTEILQEMETN